MMIFVLVTAVIVSIDAMAAGFALAMKGALSIKTILIIGLITFLLCAPAALFGEYLEVILGENVNLIGGILLIMIGLRNLVPVLCPKIQRTLLDTGKSFDAAVVGVAVGLDAAVGNLSISVMGVHTLVVPMIFAVMHIIAVAIGYIVLSFFKRSRALDFLSSFILMGVGLYKLLSLFFG